MTTTQHRQIGLAVIIGLACVIFAGWFLVFGTVNRMDAERKLLQEGLQSDSVRMDDDGNQYGSYKNMTNRTLNTVIIRWHWTNASGVRIGSKGFMTSNLEPGKMWEFKYRWPDGAKGMDGLIVSGY